MFPYVECLKPVQLAWNMAHLAHTIIRVNSVYIRYPNKIEKSLAQKMEQGKNACKPGRTVTIFTTAAERERMRQHNMDYCCMLASNIAKSTGETLANGLETYRMATKLNKLFTSLSPPSSPIHS